MARTRQLVRDLKQELAQDAATSNIVRDHQCATQIREFGTCLVCACCTASRSLALMIVLDSLELRLPETPPFPSEAVLLNILGYEKFERAAQAQLEHFSSGPSKRCNECGGQIKVWGGAREFLQNYPANTTEYRVTCQRCGTFTYFSKQDLTKFTRKRKPTGSSLPTPELEMHPARPRTRRRQARRIQRRAGEPGDGRAYIDPDTLLVRRTPTVGIPTPELVQRIMEVEQEMPDANEYYNERWEGEPDDFGP